MLKYAELITEINFYTRHLMHFIVKWSVEKMPPACLHTYIICMIYITSYIKVPDITPCNIWKILD